MIEDIKHSCYICGDRTSRDVVVWLNAFFGVCPGCYDDMTEDEKEERRSE